MTTHDKAALAFAVIVLAVLIALPAHADTCPGCMPPAPEPPVFPPVAGVGCPAVPPAVDGCEYHVYMAYAAVTGVTAQGGSGILPVRGGQ